MTYKKPAWLQVGYRVRTVPRKWSNKSWAVKSLIAAMATIGKNRRFRIAQEKAFDFISGEWVCRLDAREV